MPEVKVWRVNGVTEGHSYPPGTKLIPEIEKEIGASILDTVNLRDGRVMVVDDSGIKKGLPVNPLATALYQTIYPLAKSAKRSIYGDVAIADDADFG